MLKTRPGVNPRFRVCRRLKLDRDWGGDPAAVEVSLAELIGFDTLQIDGRRLTLFYDAGKLHLDALLERLDTFGVSLDAGRWSRLRLGWYRHTDRNIYHNARDTSSTSCAQSPLRHR